MYARSALLNGEIERRGALAVVGDNDFGLRSSGDFIGHLKIQLRGLCVEQGRVEAVDSNARSRDGSGQIPVGVERERSAEDGTESFAIDRYDGPWDERACIATEGIDYGSRTEAGCGRRWFGGRRCVPRVSSRTSLASWGWRALQVSPV